MADAERPETLPAHSQPRPASAKPSETLKVLSRLLDGFPERDVSDDAKLNRLRAYVIAVDGIPVDVISEAERRIYRNEAGLERDMMPTPPALAKLCRQIVAEEKAKALPKAQPLSLAKFEAPPSPAMVEKFERVIGEFTKVADIEGHETRAEWLKRMGDRVKLREDAA